jgi:hypothetical protein
MPQPVSLKPPVLFDGDFPGQNPSTPHRRTTFKHKLFRAVSLKDSNSSAHDSQFQRDAAPHPVQQRTNSMKEPTTTKRKWLSLFRPDGTESIVVYLR